MYKMLGVRAASLFYPSSFRKDVLREATVKKLKGAKLRTPSRLTVEVQAIGRGTTEPISSL